jgi:hypothetical protein
MPLFDHAMDRQTDLGEAIMIILKMGEEEGGVSWQKGHPHRHSVASRVSIGACKQTLRPNV